MPVADVDDRVDHIQEVVADIPRIRDMQSGDRGDYDERTVAMLRHPWHHRPHRKLAGDLDAATAAAMEVDEHRETFRRALTGWDVFVHFAAGVAQSDDGRVRESHPWLGGVVDLPRDLVPGCARGDYAAGRRLLRQLFVYRSIHTNHDHFRFTPDGLCKLFSEFEILESGSWGNKDAAFLAIVDKISIEKTEIDRLNLHNDRKFPIVVWVVKKKN